MLHSEREEYPTSFAAGRPLIRLANGAAALAAIGLAAGLTMVVRTALAGGAMASPVFANKRRLPHLETLERMAASHGQNTLIITVWLVVVVLLLVLVGHIVLQLSRRAPLAALGAGVFLAGATLSGVLVGTSELKIAEFAVQAAGTPDAEREWVGAGMNFLNQLHLFYVSGWMLCLGLCWIFVGAGLGSMGGAAGRLVLAGGSLLVVSVLARAWLPAWGPVAPGALIALGEPLATAASSLGLIGCAWLVRRMAPAVTRSRTVAVERISQIATRMSASE